MQGNWLLGLRSRKEYEVRVQLVNMWIVLCVTSCTVSPLPAPQAAVAAFWTKKLEVKGSYCQGMPQP